MAKMDISSAFRRLPIAHEDVCVLGFKFQDSYYIDKCMPMGWTGSCWLFEKSFIISSLGINKAIKI